MQLEDMDDELRNSLWNCVVDYYFTPDRLLNEMGGPYAREELKALTHRIWRDLFKIPVDTQGRNWPTTYKQMRDHFLTTTWDGVYNFVEFLPNAFAQQYGSGTNDRFVAACNVVLEREKSAWRFSGKRLTRITSEEELAAIDDAHTLPKSFRVVKEHLDSALRLMSDRKTPDYRNSIKESISAVEGFCSLLAGQDKADLNAALKTIEKKLPLHGALKSAFNSLYGYTSDANGIRHALLEESDLSFEDAKFMLVACAAFVSYLRGVASRAGLAI